MTSLIDIQTPSMESFLPGMICAIFISLILQIITIFLFIGGNNRGALVAYSTAGIVVYGIYVIADLKIIAERLEIDDYILGAITLYMDLITLFIHILRILGSKK